MQGAGADDIESLGTDIRGPALALSSRDHTDSTRAPAATISLTIS
jgi:hypothetical protein